MIPFMAHVGAYMIPSGVLVICSHLAPTPRVGSNCQISLVADTLMLKPPRMYNLLFATAKPPGKIVPALSPGQLSPAVRVLTGSVIGLEENTRAVAVVWPAAEPPTQ